MEIKHFNLNEITKYVMEALPEEKEIEIGEHLAECQKCRELAQNEFKTKRLLESWTAEAHGQAYWQNRIEKVLNSALGSTVEPSVQKRLEAWMKKWKGKVGGMVQILLSTAEKTGKVLTDFPKTLFVPYSQLKFAEIPVVRGIAKEDGEIKITSKGETDVQVFTDIENNKVIVQIEDSKKRIPLVILASGKGEPIVKEPKKIEGTNFYGACFENIAAGEYTLFFEPDEK